jgi:hypothetical protein
MYVQFLVFQFNTNGCSQNSNPIAFTSHIMALCTTKTASGWFSLSILSEWVFTRHSKCGHGIVKFGSVGSILSVYQKNDYRPGNTGAVNFYIQVSI